VAESFGVEHARKRLRKLDYGIFGQVGPAGVNELVNEGIQEVNASEPSVDADAMERVVAIAVDAAKTLRPLDLPALIADVNGAALALPAGHKASVERGSTCGQGVRGSAP
jgi:hypothetical protein